MKSPLRALSCTVLAAVAVAASASPAPVNGNRKDYAAHWEAAGLREVSKSRLDELYLRPGTGPVAGAAPLQLAPVQVSMSETWQRADRALERARMRPDEEQQIKEEVAKIVADELQQAFHDAPSVGGARPVLHAQVVNLYLNAPDMQTALHSKTYTKSFGDMALVAEVRDGEDGPLLLGSWDHRPAREWPTARLTTRVENAMEVRAAAHGWAVRLRREFDRLNAGG
jgi:hypothetical protein